MEAVITSQAHSKISVFSSSIVCYTKMVSSPERHETNTHTNVCSDRGESAIKVSTDWQRFKYHLLWKRYIGNRSNHSAQLARG